MHAPIENKRKGGQALWACPFCVRDAFVRFVAPMREAVPTRVEGRAVSRAGSLRAAR
ncbi:hypothetical protein [Burkholderia cepacia]|uniref:hypothetical protein n=1 Tax=Burkholderia cepacia TaxID=292 RepID=UPI00398EB013